MPHRVVVAIRRLLPSAIRGASSCRWGLVVTALALAINLFLFAHPAPKQPGMSDGHYMWLYARSMVFDHDVDFTNDYQLCGDPHAQGHRGPTGHPDNPFYVGPSVVWVPVLWALEHTVHLPADAPLSQKVACDGPLASRTLLTAPWLGALAVWLMYLIARRHASDAPAAFSACLLGVCSTLPAYASNFASYSHAYDAFWAAVLVWASLRAAERPERLLRWAIAGVAIGIGLLQRPVSVFFGLVPATLAIVTLRRQWQLAVGALAVLGGCAIVAGLLPQVLLYRYLYGPTFWTSMGHGRMYMHYAHAHPWLVLFAPHGGLFYTMPFAWVTVWGFVLGIRERTSRPLVVALLVACALLVWVTSAALDWSGSGTFGARRLTSLLPLMAVPTAIAVARASRWLRARPGRASTAFGIAALAPMAFTIAGASLAMSKGRIPTDVGSSQANLYGTGERTAWEAIDEDLGDVSLLPIEALFHLRYGLKMNAFQDATEAVYQRDYLTLAPNPTNIDLTHGNRKDLVTGMRSENDGMHLVGRRSTLVLAAQWPYATTIIVRGRASTPVHLHVGRGSWIGMHRWGDVTLDDHAHEARLSLPAGAFDSGILEIVFERDDPDAEVVLTGVHLQDETQYPASP